MHIRKYGIYTIKQEYFQKYDNGFMYRNKENKRPFYCAFKANNDIIWLIPLSTQFDTYLPKIQKIENKHGKNSCIYYHIGNILEKQRIFLITGIIPITEKYIYDYFTVRKKHYVIRDDNLRKDLQTKTKRYLTLVRNGKIKPSVNILEIEKQLLSEK